MPPGGRLGPGFLSEEEKQNKPKVTKELIQRIFSYLKPYWKQLMLVLAAILCSAILTLLPSVLTGKIIDEGLIARSMNALVKYIVLSFAVTLGANLIGIFESYMNTWIAQHITYDMRNSMFRHLQRMPQKFFKGLRLDEQTDVVGDINGYVKNMINGMKPIG